MSELDDLEDIAAMVHPDIGTSKKYSGKQRAQFRASALTALDHSRRKDIFNGLRNRKRKPITLAPVGGEPKEV